MSLGERILAAVEGQVAPVLAAGDARVEVVDGTDGPAEVHLVPRRSGCCPLRISIGNDRLDVELGDHGASMEHLWLSSRGERATLKRLPRIVEAVVAGRYEERVDDRAIGEPPVRGRLEGVGSQDEDTRRGTRTMRWTSLSKRGWRRVEYLPYTAADRSLPWPAQEALDVVEDELDRLGVAEAVRVDVDTDDAGAGGDRDEIPVRIGVRGERIGNCPFAVVVSGLDLTLSVGEHGAEVEAVTITARGFRRCVREGLRPCVRAIVEGRYVEYVLDASLPTQQKARGQLPDVDLKFRDLSANTATLRWDSLAAKGWRRVDYQPYSGARAG